MARETFKCANPHCKTRGVDVLMNLNSGCANLLPYCLKNKRTNEIDEKKLLKLKIEVGKLRCNDCFNTFLKRNALSSFYHLIESEETNAPEGPSGGGDGEN